MNWQPKCDLCGRFHKCEPGSAWKMVYSGGRTRCKRCVEKHGAFYPQIGIVPSYFCSIVKENKS